MKPDVKQETIYLPGNGNFWYDVWTGAQIEHHGEISVPVYPDKIPVFQLGGTIIPKKERIRRYAKFKFTHFSSISTQFSEVFTHFSFFSQLSGPQL